MMQEKETCRGDRIVVVGFSETEQLDYSVTYGCRAFRPRTKSSRDECM